MPLCTRITLVGILAAVLGGACLGGGDEAVEYLHRPDTIVVQMLSLSGDPQPEVADRVVLPGFTLYGDGTLVFVRPADDGSPSLLQAELSKEAIDELLRFIVDEGFLDFRFRHSREGAATGAPTTFLYVNTIAGVNATSAEDLDAVAPNDAKEFRSIAEIAERLAGLKPAEVAAPYEHDEVALFVQPLRLFEGEAPIWPVDTIDLAGLAPDESGVFMQILEREDAVEVSEELGEASWGRYRQGDDVFAVGYRPRLPFEEHFPEFDFSPVTVR